ncbi:MAG: HAMP domain-containing histidine kinase [Butyrivibrio sp.]|nr:HAMP domain-containing histidine kinase [Butyrivibrio sp.]
MDLKEIFEDFGRYIYYCPYELEYETNTLIKEKVLRGIIKSYSYAYPDQIKVYIGVDTKNYEAKDAFVLGKKSFGRYMPYKTQLIIAGGVAAFVYLLLLVIYLKSLCPAVAPVQYPEYKGSYIPSERLEVNESVKPPKRPCTELYLLAGLLAVGIPAAALAFMKQKWGLGTFVRMPVFPLISAVLAILVDIGILCMIYGIAGKAKSNVVWKDCAFRKLIAFAGDLVANTTGNANVIIRSWIPFIFFLVLNVLLSRAGVLGVIAAVCFDIIVGIYIYRQNLDRDNIIHVIGKIKNGDVKAKVDVKNLHGDNISLAEAVNSIGEGIDVAVNTSMKDEKLKADLITNVSHDIKTPLTSIINYVDLIKREDIDNQKVREYVDILDEKSQKLKQLTEDLVEASKISSGNISVDLSRINFVELVNQTIGEFYEKFEKSNLNPIFKPQEPTMDIIADPRHLWRVIENLLNNVCKYALAGTRVYLDMRYSEEGEDEKKVIFSVKNISASELNIDAAELTERFIRGDVSRTTEGSGLGLSIAKNLTLAQDGTFDIRLDGDLFKVTIGFKSPK